jgi:WD40 repeat protein
MMNQLAGAPQIWDAESGKALQKLEGHAGAVLSVAFSPDNKKIVSVGYDKTVRIWDAQSGKELHTLEKHTEMMTCAVFSPDGKKIVTVSDDDTGRIWDVESGKVLQNFNKRSGGSFLSVAFSPDGKKFVTVGNTAHIWETESGKELQTLKGHTDLIRSATFSLDGKKIVTVSWDKTARIWDAESGKQLLKRQITGLGAKSQLSAALSPDGRKMVAASEVLGSTVRIFDAESGKELHTLEGHTGGIYHVATSSDGKQFITASDDGTLRFWDWERFR